MHRTFDFRSIRNSWTTRSTIAVVSIGVAFILLQGCTLKSKYTAVVNDLEVCESEKISVENSLEACKSNKAQVETEAQQLDEERKRLNAQLVASKKATAERHAHYQGLVSELKEEISDEHIKVKEMESGISVNLTQEVLFSPGSAELTEDGHKMLMKVGRELAPMNYQTLVSGFTDNVPVPVGGKLAEKYPTNWELAGARAAIVVRVLEKAGVASSQLGAVSFGENSPVASNDTPEGRAKNRRIEIVLRPVVIEK